MSRAIRKQYADLKMMSSHIVDENGNIVSLSAVERDAVTNAVGDVGASNPLTTKKYVDDAIVDSIDQSFWRPAVGTLSDTAPVNPVVGDRYVNTSDQLIYNCSVDGVWDESGEVPKPNWSVVAEDTDELYTYNAELNEWVMRSTGSIPSATEEIKGIVELAEHFEVESKKVVQSNDPRLGKGSFKESFTGALTYEVFHNLGTTDLIVQVWQNGSVIESQIDLKNGAETTTLVVTLNTTADVKIVVLGL